LIKWILNFLRKRNFGDDDIGEFKTFVSEHIIQEVFHGIGVGWTFNVVNFKMSLSSDQNSYSFSNGSLELLVKLVDTNSVNEVEDIILSFHALENNSDTKTNENIIVSWASSNLELVCDVLLGNKELNLGPW